MTRDSMDNLKRWAFIVSATVGAGVILFMVAGIIGLVRSETKLCEGQSLLQKAHERLVETGSKKAEENSKEIAVVKERIDQKFNTVQIQLESLNSGQTNMDKKLDRLLNRSNDP